jgi:hypothetical protein
LALKNFPVALGITPSVKPVVKGLLFVADGSDGYKVLMPHAAAHGIEEGLEYRVICDERFCEKRFHSISFR